MKSNYWIFLFLGITAFASAPSKNLSVVWKNTSQLKTFDCSKFSDELAKGVVAEVRKMKDVTQHWFLMCTATESDPTTFDVKTELFITAKNQNGDQEINNFLQLHQNEVVQGISLDFLKVQKFTVQTKIKADKLSLTGGSHLEVLGFAERTYLTDYYSEYADAVTKAKNALKGTDIRVVLDYIRFNYGEAAEIDFERNLLPKANSVVEKFQLSFLLEDGTTLKSIPSHQTTRDCKTETKSTCL